ncbi:phosphoribosyltransferase [Streptomyces armeniacus]|uniref:Phosphoribosyltransferase n=1 Tax=Streptomyces armeniacus TaxID=83291 RepID=A0A345XZ62_9ACTN|nr:phosphoribosyltransferase family protein [Streptomyces armeniacus]AXK36928.1 phosphoribosyltransferase [Streptomyces armeniacus]
MRFHDRRQAGRALASEIMNAQPGGGPEDPLVLGLPRGGVPVAAEVARTLDAPLDVLVARKIGAPGNPEVGVGALAGDAPPYFDSESLAMLGLTPERLEPAVAREREELRRREELYQRGRPPLDLDGRAVIIVDDGLATGVTARAALRSARERGARWLLLAVPVGAEHTAAALESEADQVLCLHRSPAFRSVGEWYKDFRQLDDDEVISALGELASRHG